MPASHQRQPGPDPNYEAGLEPYVVPYQVEQHGLEVNHKPSGDIIPVDGVAGQRPISTLAEAESKIRVLRRTIVILAVSLLLVITAAAVGGGVGGTMAVKAAKSAAAAEALATAVTTYPLATTSSSSNPSSSSTGVAAAPTPMKLALDCPRMDQTDIRVDSFGGSGVFTFSMKCDHDMPGLDTLGVRVYSLTDCLRACARHNEFTKSQGATDLKAMTACRAVVFSSNMLQHVYGNCWLKNGTTTPRVPVDLERIGPMVAGTVTGYS